MPNNVWQLVQAHFDQKQTPEQAARHDSQLPDSPAKPGSLLGPEPPLSSESPPHSPSTELQSADKHPTSLPDSADQAGSSEPSAPSAALGEPSQHLLGGIDSSAQRLLPEHQASLAQPQYGMLKQGPQEQTSSGLSELPAEPLSQTETAHMPETMEMESASPAELDSLAEPFLPAEMEREVEHADSEPEQAPLADASALVSEQQMDTAVLQEPEEEERNVHALHRGVFGASQAPPGKASHPVKLAHTTLLYIQPNAPLACNA